MFGGSSNPGGATSSTASSAARGGASAIGSAFGSSSDSDDYLSSGKINSNLSILNEPAPAKRVGTDRLTSQQLAGVTNPQQKSKDLYLEGYGRDFGVKITYSMGLTYGIGILAGGTYGIAKGLQQGESLDMLFLDYHIAYDLARSSKLISCRSMCAPS